MSYNTTVLPKSKFQSIKKLADIEVNKSRIDYERSLSIASNKLLKKWEGPNEEKQQQKEREKKKIQEVQSLIQFYNNIMDKKSEQKEQLSAHAKNTIFKQKADIKALENAFLYADILREQEIQRDFEERLKREAKQRDAEYIDFMVERFGKWHLKQKQLLEQRRRKAIDYSLQYQQEVEELRMKRRQAKQDHLKLEIEEREKALAKIKAEEMEAAMQKKKNQNDFKRYVDHVIEEREKNNEEERKFAEKEQKVIDINHNAQITMAEKRKRKEKEIENTKIQVRKHVTAFRKTEKNIDKEIENINNRAAEEFYMRELKRSEAENNHTKVVKEDRIKAHEKWLLEKEEKRELKKKLKNEEHIQCVKNLENTKILYKRIREKKLKKIEEIKSFNLKQEEEKATNKAREKEENIYFYNDRVLQEMEDADIKYFSYASELLKECEIAGRPKDPVLKAIRDYKSQYSQTQKLIRNNLERKFPEFFADEE